LERILELKILLVGDFSSLKLTNDAVAILKSQQSVDIKSSRLQLKPLREKKVKQAEEFEYDEELFEALREKRKELASELGVPPYIIFGDKTLKHLAHLKPQDKDDMLEVNGVGEKKFNSFGEEFLAVIEEYL
jgi:ATP-dependent DNA helicase RecQ